MINRYSVLLLIMLISCLSFNSYSQETKKVTFKNSNPPYSLLPTKKHFMC